MKIQFKDLFFVKVLPAAILLLTVSGIIHFFSFGKVEHVCGYPIYDSSRTSGVAIPDTLYFAKERVPVEFFDVKESLDKELLINTYWHSQTITFMKRAYRYFPEIEPILKQYGIPDDFKYIPVIESGFQPVTSPQGAKGYWQIIESTAKDHKLEINDEIDERLNVQKSTIVACKYFRSAYEKFHSWTLVAASYNMGMAGIERQLMKQKVLTFYDLGLNSETARYVFRIIAVKLIMEYPELYGYKVPEKQRYPVIPCKTVGIDSTISNLADFANNQGINYKMLKMFNPWLLDNKLTITDGKHYEIKIPKEGYRDLTFEDDYPQKKQ